MEALTVQGLLEQHLEGILARNGFPAFQQKALRKLSVCRTQALGGHAQYCAAGHLNGVWYNSCKHRACPQCQGIANERWLRNTQSILLDCSHHHVIFTLPSTLDPLWRHNRALLSSLLFTAAQKTLQQFSRDRRYLGAVPGILSVLHTWGRSLSLHPHLHMLISHGGIDAEGQWVVPKKKALFPQKPVMQVFRGKLLALLRAALDDGSLTLPADRRAHHIATLLNQLGRRDWVVHFCQRYDYATGVAKYLAKYVKGGPFRPWQLKEISHGQVRFCYRSHQTGCLESLTLSQDAFAQRLAEHVPTPGKPNVRYCGLYASPCRKALNQARQALGQQAVSQREVLSWQTWLEEKGYRPTCDVCGLPLFHAEKTDAVRRAA